MSMTTIHWIVLIEEKENMNRMIIAIEEAFTVRYLNHIVVF